MIFVVYMGRDQNFNVIILDWSELCAIPWYIDAVENTKLVAYSLAKFIEFFHYTGELQVSKVHLIGFSLGAQVAGLTGKFLRKGLRIPRITALDPAFPLYSLGGKANV